MKHLQERYYKGCSSSSQFTGDKDDIDFYEHFKKASKESNENFINSSDLLISELSDYLLNTQKDKYYMLYTDQSINLYHINSDDYEIASYEKEATKSRFVATTKTGHKLYILLRWKNGNGIAYPAFQIK